MNTLRLRLGLPIESGIRVRIREESEVPEVVQRMLERYIDLIDRELASLYFNEAEALLICNALNTRCPLDIASVWVVWPEVIDAITRESKRGVNSVDRDALVTKLQSLCPGQRLAVVDAVECFWQRPEPVKERLREVGLVDYASAPEGT